MAHLVESDDGDSLRKGGRNKGTYADRVRAKPRNVAESAARSQTKTQTQTAKQPRQQIEKKAWETPPMTKSQFQTTVETSTDNSLAKAREVLKQKAIRGLLTIRETRNKRVQMVCRDAQQLELVKKVCDSEKWQCWAAGDEWPMSHFVGVESETPDEEVVRNLTESAVTANLCSDLEPGKTV